MAWSYGGREGRSNHGVDGIFLPLQFGNEVTGANTENDTADGEGIRNDEIIEINP